MPYPMIDSLTGSYVMIDGRLLSVDHDDVHRLQQPVDDQMFYEVIRIADGIPLFWEDHLQRLQASTAGRLDLPAVLLTESRELIRQNHFGGANLRLVITARHRVLHLIPSYYPTADQLAHGVATGLLTWERNNPNIKEIHADYKAAVSAGFARQGPYGPLFELLLADRDGQLTEGSRSNLFFIRGEQVLTAPDQCILKGITRKYVCQAIQLAGGQLVTEMLTFQDVQAGKAQAAFLSGSPIDLVPVSAMEDYPLPSAENPLFQRISLAYNRILQDYIDNHA